MKKIFALFLIFLFALSSAEAKFRQTCKVKYKKEYGWSQYYTVEVTFLSGFELNQATRSYNYNTYSLYAVVFWGKEQASVIKTSSTSLCGTEPKEDCINARVNNLVGEDQEERKWEICTMSYCF